MIASSASLAYRRAALQQASTVGLVVALCDTLIGNLARAAAAIERNDIEDRCAELIHGFKVLQQLDLMLDMENGGRAAINLRRFYTHLRGHMLAAQFKLSPNILREQIRLIMIVREAWQEVDSRETQPLQPSASSLVPATNRERIPTPHTGAAWERVGSSFSCSG